MKGAWAPFLVALAAGLAQAQIPPPVITTTFLPDATRGASYSATINASGGVAPYTWAFFTGVFGSFSCSDPAVRGLTLNTPTTVPSTTLSGTVPTSVNPGSTVTFCFAVAAPSSSGLYALTLTTNDLPTAINGTPTTGIVGAVYNLPLSVTGGTVPFQWSIIVGSLPGGLAIDPATGAITGTPTTAQTSNFTVQAIDANGAIITRAMSITINPALAFATASPLAPGVVGIALSRTITGTGGIPPYTLTQTGGTLPGGTTFTNGVLSGTPTASGTFTFAVQLCDSRPGRAPFCIPAQNFQITIVPALSITTGSNLPFAVQGSSYQAPAGLQFQATGGTPPYNNWSAVSLPPGMSLSSLGVMSGTPTLSGTYSFSVSLIDSGTPQPSSTSKFFFITVDPLMSILTTSPLPAGVVGVSYNAALSATGGTPSTGGPPYTWSLISGTLPAGLTLNAGGSITGNPTAAGTANFTLGATDLVGQLVTRPFSLTIAASLSITTTSPLPLGIVNTAYSPVQLQAAGGTGAYTWTVIPTTFPFPSGMTLSPSGVLAGTPTATGSSPILFQVTDSATPPQSTSQFLTINVDSLMSITTASPLPTGVVGVSYNVSLNATGGTPSTGGPPYVWSLVGGTLPPGLAVNPAGSIASNPLPTTAGTYNFTLGALDTLGQQVTKAFSLTIVPALSITTATNLPFAVQGSSYQAPGGLQLQASGGTPPYNNWSAVSLPPGMSLSSLGILGGTPTLSGTYSFQATVLDSSQPQPLSASKTFSIFVDPPMSITTASPLPTGLQGQAYNGTLAASGGTPGYTWSTVSGALPAGIVLSGAGALSGTPTAAGTFNFTAGVTDAIGAQVSKAFTLVIGAPLSIASTSPLASGEVNVPYSLTLAANGGIPSLSWSLNNSTLPAGLALSSAGALTGTPTQAGTFTFNVRVIDSATVPQAATGAFQLTIFPALSITTTSLPNAIIGASYSRQIATSGGSGTNTFSVATGTLPPGLALSSTTGTVSGTPTGTGNTYNFTVRAADTAGGAAQQAYTVTTATQLAVQSPASPLPPALTGTTYSQTFAAAGGSAPYSWSAQSPPPGLSMSASGVLSGTPSTPGSYNFAVTVTDGSAAFPQSVTGNYALTVDSVMTITTLSPLSLAVVGVPYSQTFANTGGTAAYSWSLAGGTLPPGLNLSSGGTLAGIPVAAGAFSFTIQVTDGLNFSQTKAFTLTVAQPLFFPPPVLPVVQTGLDYSVTLSASGGLPPLAWTVSAGSLPPGITLTSNGVLSGTTDVVGVFPFTVRVSSSAAGPQQTATAALLLTVVNPVSITTASPLPQATVGAVYGSALEATGGIPPYTFSLQSGTLPPGLTLTPAGVLQGVPATVGTFNFAVVANSSAANILTTPKAFTLVVAAPLSIATSALAGGVIGQPYSQKLQGAGGAPPYKWSLQPGTAAAGIGLSSDGLLSGVPTAAGTFPLSIQLSDSGNVSVTRSLELVIKSLQLQFQPPPPPQAKVGIAYFFKLVVTGGKPEYTFRLSGSSMPFGLSLTSDGAIVGTPVEAGAFRFTIQVTDAANESAVLQVELVVAPPDLTITTSVAADGSVDAPYSQAFSATGGAEPYGWSLGGGALPPGTSLSPAGVLSGTPSTAGSYPFTLSVKDARGTTASRPFTVTIGPPLLAIVTAASLPDAVAGRPYSLTLAATGGAPPYTWSVSGLPPGLSLNADTGSVTGTPTTAGAFTAAATVRDSAGATATRALSLTIPLPALPPVTISGLPPQSPPLDQPILRLNIEGSFPAPIDGVVTLVFVADSGGTDATVQFATGGRTARFTIPANANLAQFTIPNMALQTGSVAGTITLTATFGAAGVDITPVPAPSVTVRVVPAPPVIRSVTAARTSTGFTVTVVGLATTREVASAVFRFNPSPGSNLQTNEVTVAVPQLFAAWYADPQSGAYGSQFTFTQPFNVQGDTSALASVTVTLANSLGSSQPATATVP